MTGETTWAQENSYLIHVLEFADLDSQIRATDVQRLVVELPERFDVGDFLRWLIARPDLSERAGAEATELLRFTEKP